MTIKAKFTKNKEKEWYSLSDSHCNVRTCKRYKQWGGECFSKKYRWWHPLISQKERNKERRKERNREGRQERRKEGNI